MRPPPISEEFLRAVQGASESGKLSAYSKYGNYIRHDAFEPRFLPVSHHR